jgi:hypothetical protein
MVIGGWSMKGAGQSIDWLETVDLLDLRSPGARWESIPQPFSRRALITATLGDHVFVMGGFDATDTPSLDVDIFHTKTRSWSKGPSIPGDTRNGFAPAACVHDGLIYLSVASGEIYRLKRDWTAWELYGRNTPRIVHRMVVANDEILILGGAAEAKMVDLVEAVSTDRSVTPAPMVAAAKKPDAGGSNGHADEDEISRRMHEIDDIVDRLKVIDREAWKPSGKLASHDPALDCEQLAAIFAELAASDSAKKKPADFATMMHASHGELTTLRTLLAEPQRDHERLKKQFRAVLDSCKSCHSTYRE